MWRVFFIVFREKKAILKNSGENFCVVSTSCHLSLTKVMACLLSALSAQKESEFERRPTVSGKKFLSAKFNQMDFFASHFTAGPWGWIFLLIFFIFFKRLSQLVAGYWQGNAVNAFLTSSFTSSALSYRQWICLFNPQSTSPSFVIHDIVTTRNHILHRLGA